MRKPCRGCKKPSASAICEDCKAGQERARAPRAARGYGPAYDRARERLRASFAPGESRCVICGLVIHKLSDWTCEHVTPIRDGGGSELANLGHAHAACNYGWRRRRQDGR